MSQPLCPKCSSPLKDDYGMATCAKCGSFVFVDMDGQAHFSEDEPARTAQRKTDPPMNLPEGLEESAPELVPMNFDAPAAEMNPAEYESVTSNEPVDLQAPAETHNAPIEEHVAYGAAPEDPAQQVSEEFDMDKMLGFQQAEVEARAAEFAQPGD